MFDNITTVTQGGIGLAQAIATFAKLGYNVSVPLIDNQCYDLVIEKDLTFYKVQVKTSRQLAPSGNYIVELKRVRANRTENKIHKFCNTEVDFLFILTAAGDCYLIPALDIGATGAITLGDKYKQYKL